MSERIQIRKPRRHIGSPKYPKLHHHGVYVIMQDNKHRITEEEYETLHGIHGASEHPIIKVRRRLQQKFGIFGWHTIKQFTYEKPTDSNACLKYIDWEKRNLASLPENKS